jgi:hypothetical protein
MKPYKEMFLCCTLGFLLTTLAGCSSVSHTCTPQTSAKPQYLFIVHAQNGQLQRVHKTYVISLDQPVITYFSDRPYRKTGHLNRQQFLNLWKAKFNDNFASDHPNAALAGLNYHPDHPKDADQAVETTSLMVLNQAQWDSKIQRLTIIIVPLNDKLTLGKLDDVVLFVDGAWIPGDDF